MFKKNLLFRALVTAGLTTGLVACGGGGSSTGDTPPADQNPPTENTGNFIDSPVGGLEYEAKPSGITGVTDDDGSFRYVDGDAVYFRVGNYLIGSADATSMISPKSIGLTNEDAVANIARFLQTLDDDGILENGITINNAARETARNSTGGEVSALDLTSEGVKTEILELTEKNSVQRTELVDRASALGHLNQTLADFEAASIASCSAEAPAVEETRIADKTFGRIAQGEVTLFTFESEGNKVIEIANDQGEIKSDEGTWLLDGQGKTMTLTFTDQDPETITVCDASNSIILESGDTSNKFYDVVPADASAGRSFLLSSATEQADTGAILQLTSASEYETISGNGFKTGTWFTDGNALKLNDGEIYFLRGQNKRIGILVEQDATSTTSTVPANVGTATAIPNLSDTDSATFTGNNFLLRNEGENSVYMLDFTGTATFERFSNQEVAGQQEALYSQGDWNLSTANETTELSLTVDGIKETFKVWDAGNLLFLAAIDSDTVKRLYETQPVTLGTFSGTYNVNIPTENVVDNTLVINDDKTCSYDSTACQWAINAKGHAVLSFPGKTEQGHIWQVAGRTNAFGFVMKHSDANDIEPGFMTRQ